MFPRKVFFIGAKSSLEKKVVGFFMRGMNSIIPVDREIDHIHRGPGIITIKGNKVTGNNTHFTLLHPRDSIVIKRNVYRIIFIFNSNN